MKYDEAVALLREVDLDRDLLPDFLYFAAVSLGATGRLDTAIGLLKRALSGGYPRFWCAYHLGLFEENRRDTASAAYYYTISLILEPERSDIRELLERIAPHTDFTLLREAQSGKQSGTVARKAFRRGEQMLQAEKAVTCFAIALTLDPLCVEARTALLRLTPNVTLDVTSDIDFDRVAAELLARLETPDPGNTDIERKLAVANWAAALYYQTGHHSGYNLIPGLQLLFRRAIGNPAISIDTICRLYSLIYFLYFFVAWHREQMRGIVDQVMKPFAAAIREGALPGLPAGGRQRLGREPLRVGFLSQYARLDVGNAVGPFAHFVLGGLARYFPQHYKPALYAWEHHDEHSLSLMTEAGVLVRRFDAEESLDGLVHAVANAVAADEIDILLTDQNSWLPTVLFERRIAPIQIQYNMGGLSFWAVDNLDAVFRIDVTDPALDGFPIDKCFPLGLGPWDRTLLAPPVDPARIASERQRFPDANRLIGNYGRLAKITPDFLAILAELSARHPDIVIALGGTGDGDAIRTFIAAHGLRDRLVLIDEFVDGHVWGHMLEVFVDTFPSEGGVSRREMMAKSRPVVTMQGSWAQFDAVPMLVAGDRDHYVQIVSRLVSDPEFYDSACAATREFVSAGMSHFDYAAAVHQALTKIVERKRQSVDS
jgi:hypothetical protein